VKSFYIEVYDTNVFVTSKRKRYIKFVEKSIILFNEEFDPNDDPAGECLPVNYKWHDCIAVYISNRATGLITHESVHAVNFLYRYVGAKLDMLNDEPQAYLTEYIADQIDKCLIKE